MFIFTSCVNDLIDAICLDLINIWCELLSSYLYIFQ